MTHLSNLIVHTGSSYRTFEISMNRQTLALFPEDIFITLKCMYMTLYRVQKHRLNNWFFGVCRTAMWSTRPVFGNRQFMQSESQWIAINESVKSNCINLIWSCYKILICLIKIWFNDWPLFQSENNIIYSTYFLNMLPMGSFKGQQSLINRCRAHLSSNGKYCYWMLFTVSSFVALYLRTYKCWSSKWYMKCWLLLN